MPKNVVINPFFDWGHDRAPQIPVPRDGHLRGARARADPAPSRRTAGPARHLRRPGAPRRHRAPAAARRHGRRADAGAPVRVRAVPGRARPESTTGATTRSGSWPRTTGTPRPGSAASRSASSRRMVKALHEAGIEVILDVVYNHTAEGDHRGPTLSFRGIDNSAYYRLDGAGAVALPGLHRLREQPERPAPARAAAGHGLAAVLGPGDARRRVPVRPGLGAGPGTARRGPAVHVLRPGPAGPGGVPGQADRRAVGRGRGRLPGGQLPAVVDRVEREVPRRRPGLLAGPPGVDSASSPPG